MCPQIEQQPTYLLFPIDSPLSWHVPPFPPPCKPNQCASPPCFPLPWVFSHNLQCGLPLIALWSFEESTDFESECGNFTDINGNRRSAIVRSKPIYYQPAGSDFQQPPAIEISVPSHSSWNWAWQGTDFPATCHIFAVAVGRNNACWCWFIGVDLGSRSYWPCCSYIHCYLVSSRHSTG